VFSYGTHRTPSLTAVKELGCTVQDGPLDSLIITEPRKPFHVALLPEPGHLAFGIPAGIALRVENRLLQAQFTVQELYGLAVAVRFEGLGARGKSASQNPAHFFDQPTLKHPFAALVKPPVEFVPRRRKANLQRAIAAERVTALAKHFRGCAAC